ncbi:MAG: response regulator transcription factor [Magnetospirillum sp.]|nr:response regulator transcription factor [Magnetospirillum sp.]
MRSATRILIVNDDAPLRRALAEHLGGHGFAVAEAATAAEGLALAAGHDLVVVDDRPPTLDGRALCLGLRQAGLAAPLVLLTVAADSCCADAVVAKPFRLGALVAALRGLAARHRSAAPLAVGRWLFDRTRRCLCDGAGTQTRLTDKEAAILERLHGAGGAVTRETLLTEVWGYSAAVTTHTVETHIYRLRRKLGDDLLVTEPGGYRLAKPGEPTS